ncbi:flagellar biosynthetic protein FliO [Clostridium bowmanii]|uniref:flagellar biosynthetic protein FliO n=1 Tax=Clostridium bowmanii TaxID=132925 RepID=UPI001C0C98DF|nr:flagellar biosynthetic protein FliO [Clostridium bowmanii]MBU3190574.1 flagellar biosynthetic protein FliO [Clostridium bowmanii]MCA1075105.1 flagellar biosynthetic protein FliO [Clostridium bowmanii]
MDLDFWTLLFKIIIFLPFILLLLYLSLKYGGNKLQKLQNGRYMKVLDRIALSKENSIIVVKIGEKAYAISSSLKGINILFELPKEEISSIESIKEIPQYEDMKELFKKHIINSELADTFKKRIMKKGAKDEKKE